MTFGFKITGDTTLRQLAILRASYGVERIVMHHAPTTSTPVSVELFTADFCVRGIGAIEAQALDDAFQRLMHRIGSACLQAYDEKANET